MLSKRIQNIKESGIRKVFSMAEKHKEGLVNLSIGQPHFPTPSALKKSATKAILENNNSYTPTAGLSELRQKIADKLKKENNIKAKKEEILITSGVSGALFLVFSALFDKGDEIIVPEPCFVSYKQTADFYEIKVKYLDTHPSFKINPAKLKKMISKKTKAIIINSPANPTGIVYSQKELIQIAKLAKEFDLWIISDEIYEIFDYDKKFFSIGSVYKKTITLNGFSKSHSITGWRIGYLHAPEKIVNAMSNLQQYSFVCAPSFAQKAILESFDANLKKGRDYYLKNRDFLYQKLKDYYEFQKPAGAFYAYLKIPKNKDKFVEKLIKRGLLVVPGEVFSKKNDYFRVCFAVDRKTLEKGIDILKKSA